MSQPQKCTACGYTGYDVGPRLVRTNDPAKPFAVQVRCIDSEACEDRVFTRREPRG